MALCLNKTIIEVLVRGVVSCPAVVLLRGCSELSDGFWLPVKPRSDSLAE